MCDSYFERVNKKIDNLTDDEFLRLIDESQKEKEKEIYNKYLKTYEKFQNKGVYKYNINDKKHIKDVQELIDILG